MEGQTPVGSHGGLPLLQIITTLLYNLDDGKEVD